MIVKKIGNSNHVRVEELLPCKDFHCIHELMSCAITIWCPDGCYDTNDYYGYCIPDCMDCVEYYKCKKEKKIKRILKEVLSNE